MADEKAWPVTPGSVVSVGSTAPAPGALGQSIVIRSDGTIGYVDDSVRVEAWGGKFDGVTDDTTAWQNALNVGKRYIRARDGTSITSADLTVPGGRWIMGEGMGATTIKRTGATAGKVFTNANQGAFGTDSDITISDLCVDRTAGGTGLSPYDNCIHMRYVDGITVQRVRARGGMKGVHLEGCDDGDVSHCRIDSFRDNAVAVTDAAGFGGTDLTYPIVIVAQNRVRQTAATKDPGGSSPLLATQDGTVFDDNTVVSTVALNGNAVEIGAGTGRASVDIAIVNNHLYGGGVLVGGVTSAKIIGNDLHDGAIATSAFLQCAAVGGVTPTRPTIRDNTIEGTATVSAGAITSTAGIKVASGVTFAKVHGNDVSGGGNIYVQADDADVQGNTVDGSVGNGLTVTTCARPVVKNNTVRNPGQAGAGLSVDSHNGFTFDTLTNPTIGPNLATSSDTNMSYGYYINAGTGVAWTYNDAVGAQTAIVRTTGVPTYRGTSPVGP